MTADRRHGGARSSTWGVVGMAALGLAACGSGASSPSANSHPPSTTSIPAGTTSTTTGASGDTPQTAVLNAWESAQQTLYGYLQAPWQQDRANLVAGETAATLWPNLANYFVDPALQSEQTFLVGREDGPAQWPDHIRSGYSEGLCPHLVNGDSHGLHLRLGHHDCRRQARTSSHGGGAGGYSGTWNLQLISGSWKIVSFKTVSVSKC